MKRFGLDAILLCVINGAAITCGAAAVFFAVFMQNYVAATLPVLVILLLSLWQPWLIVWFVAAWLAPYPLSKALVLSAPVVPVGITLAVYRARFWHNKPPWLPAVWLRAPLRTRGGGVLLAAMLISIAGYKDVPPQHQSLPPLHWMGDSPVPPNIALQCRLKDSRYYTLGTVDGLGGEFLWRVRVSRLQLPGLTKALALHRVRTGRFPAPFWRHPPYWWRRPENVVDVYQTESFSAGGKDRLGWHAGAEYAVQAETLYVWGKQNGE